MKLYGNFFSSPANIVRYAANAMNVDYDYVHVDLVNGEHHKSEYKAISRFGKVPALQDGDFCLCESGAISRYLAGKAGSDLYPSNAQARAKTDEWMDYAAMHTRLAMSKVLFNMKFAPMMGIAVDENSLKEGRTMLEGQFPTIEATLSETSFLAGEKMTMADITMLGAMDPFEMIDVSLKDYPAISKWRAGLMAQDFYQRAHSHYGAELEG